MIGDMKEVPLGDVNLTQLAGSVRNWLLDRSKDVQDARPWDQRPAEDQERAISQAEAFGMNLVSDIAEAIYSQGLDVIQATIGKVTTDGAVLKADLTLPVDGSEGDVHAMVDAAGKKVTIVVTDIESFLGREGRPEVNDDQGQLGLAGGAAGRFERLYARTTSVDISESQFPSNDWLYGLGGISDGLEWLIADEYPNPTDDRPIVLEASRVVGGNAVNGDRIEADWEKPELAESILDGGVTVSVDGRDQLIALMDRALGGDKWREDVVVVEAFDMDAAIAVIDDIHQGEEWRSGKPGSEEISFEAASEAAEAIRAIICAPVGTEEERPDGAESGEQEGTGESSADAAGDGATSGEAS